MALRSRPSCLGQRLASAAGRMQTRPRLGPERRDVEALAVETPAVTRGAAVPAPAPGRLSTTATTRRLEGPGLLFEELFPRVQLLQPELADVITGMILSERLDKEVLLLLESETHLKATVDQAAHALQQSFGCGVVGVPLGNPFYHDARLADIFGTPGTQGDGEDASSSFIDLRVVDLGGWSGTGGASSSTRLPGPWCSPARWA